jgi:hypothetical protein
VGRRDPEPPERADAGAKPYRAPPEPGPEGVRPEGILRLQQEVGNARVTSMLAAAALLRTPVAEGRLATPEDPVHHSGEHGLVTVVEDPNDVEVPGAPPATPLPPLDPEVAKKVVAMRTVLRNVRPLDEKSTRILERAVPGARVVELMKTREQLRKDVWLADMALRWVVPDAESEQSRRLVATVTAQVESKRVQLEQTQREISGLVKLAGVKDEDALTTYVNDEFPTMFLDRAGEIAYQQLEANRRVVEKEAERFGVTKRHLKLAGDSDDPEEIFRITGTPSAQDAAGMRAAAAELAALHKATEEAEGNVHPFGHMEDEYDAAQQTGNPDPANQMPYTNATTAEYEAQQRLGLEYPLLFHADPEKLAAADSDLQTEAYEQVVQITKNINETEKSIAYGKLKIWSLREITDITMLDLGISADSPLMDAVNAHIKDEESEERLITIAKAALQIGASIVAAFATGGVSLVASAISIGLGLDMLRDASASYSAEKAASNVALDPAIADISVNEPKIMPVALAVVGVVADAGMLAKALVALRPAATALIADGDIARFSGAAHQVLSANEAEALVNRVSHLPEVVEATTRGAGAGGGVADAAWTHEQILELFARAYKRPGPPAGSITFHATEAEFTEAARLAGSRHWDTGRLLGFYDRSAGILHLPPGSSLNTVIHESLHLVAQNNGVREIMGRFLNEGMTEWLARAEFGPNGVMTGYEANVTFTEMLASRVGAGTLRDAYLHGRWGELRRALVRLLGSEEQVQHWYGLVRGLGPEGGGAALDEAARMIVAGSM